MADQLEIQVTISPSGEVTLETRGLKGTECLAETKGLEEKLGRVTARTKTAEYWQQAATTSVTARRR